MAINTGAVSRDDTVAVIGCGGVGDAAIAGAALVGARRIIAVDTDATKLDWARTFGATHTVNARDCDVRGNVITDPMSFPRLGNGKDFVGEEVSGGIYVAAARDIRISGNKITVGTPPVCPPIVLGPKVDRQTISIGD